MEQAAAAEVVERTIVGGVEERVKTLWERMRGYFWLPNWYYWKRGCKKEEVPTLKAKASKEAVKNPVKKFKKEEE